MKKFYLLMLFAAVFSLCGNEVKVQEFSLSVQKDGKFILHKPGTEKVNGYFFLKNGKTEKLEACPRGFQRLLRLVFLQKIPGGSIWFLAFQPSKTWAECRNYSSRVLSCS